MKKLTLFLILTIFISCTKDSPFSPDSDSSVLTKKTTTLTIKNNTSSSKIDLVKWNGTYFGDNTVWDAVLNKNTEGIIPGSQSVRAVTAGSAYIYFWFTTGGSEFRTSSLITVSEGEKAIFSFIDSTPVIEN